MLLRINFAKNKKAPNPLKPETLNLKPETLNLKP